MEAVILVLQDICRILLVVVQARDVFSRSCDAFCEHKTSSWHLVDICGSGRACSKQRLLNTKSEKGSPQILFTFFLSHSQYSTTQRMIMKDMLNLCCSFDAMCWSAVQQWCCSLVALLTDLADKIGGVVFASPVLTFARRALVDSPPQPLACMQLRRSILKLGIFLLRST